MILPFAKYSKWDSPHTNWEAGGLAVSSGCLRPRENPLQEIEIQEEDFLFPLITIKPGDSPKGRSMATGYCLVICLVLCLVMSSFVLLHTHSSSAIDSMKSSNETPLPSITSNSGISSPGLSVKATDEGSTPIAS